MSCQVCGMPCNGSLCRDCERMEHQEDYYGTTESNFGGDENERWGEGEGQTTLAGGEDE